MIATDEATEVQPGAVVKTEVKEEPAIVGNKVKKEEPAAEKTTTKATTSRDNSKYKFNGEEYGKGPLDRAVVAKYVDDHPDTTYKQLKEIFSDTLMKRFGCSPTKQRRRNFRARSQGIFSSPSR